MKERDVNLQEMLSARERRTVRQGVLLMQHDGALISFTMNIPGPRKNSPLIRRAFRTGCAMLDAALRDARLPVAYRETDTAAPTGCQAFYAVSGDAAAVKRLCVALEEGSDLGRLFDMDVLSRVSAVPDRAAVGGRERGCIICGAPGRSCASRRIHDVAALQSAVRRILERHFAAADQAAVAALVTRALLEEVHTTPKPGLVDAANTGSHTDMELADFAASATALTPYWALCVSIGRESAAQPPEETFRRLRQVGCDAEEVMRSATGGVNTHKGAIFTLGVLCGAVGRLWHADAPCRDPKRLARECAAMTAAPVADELAALRSGAEAPVTAGQRLYLRCGLTGARGEVATGLPGVIETALPAFRHALDAGCSRNDAGAIALLHLIARGTDTNMAARGGTELAAAAAAEARELLNRFPLPPMAEITALDRSFIRRNLSPGGCADLLAVTYFLHDWQEGEA